jgi:hypothetical protein
MHETGAWKLCHPVGFGGTSLAHELFMNTYVRRSSSFTGIIIFCYRGKVSFVKCSSASGHD